jgi:hypothetical protein
LIILAPAFEINDLADFCEKIDGLQSLTSKIFNPKKLASLRSTPTECTKLGLNNGDTRDSEKRWKMDVPVPPGN